MFLVSLSRHCSMVSLCFVCQSLACLVSHITVVWKWSICFFGRRSQKRSMRLRWCMRKLLWKSPLPLTPRWLSLSLWRHLSCEREMTQNMVAVLCPFMKTGPLISLFFNVTLPTCVHLCLFFDWKMFTHVLLVVKNYSQQAQSFFSGNCFKLSDAL